MIDEHRVYANLEKRIEAFAPAISDMEELLRSIPNEDIRKTLLRSLGEVMAHLEEMAYEYRKHLGLTELE